MRASPQIGDATCKSACLGFRLTIGCYELYMIKCPFVRLLVVSFLLLCAAATSPAQVIISEFEASNTTGLKDEGGAYSDWIELFNGSTTNVNLNGWYLTDSSGNLTKWRIPAVVM